MSDSETDTLLEYDAQGRLVRVVHRGTVTTYNWDGDQPPGDLVLPALESGEGR